MKTLIVGPACSGKDHLRKRMEAKGLFYGPFYTNRQPRPEERPTVDYYFSLPKDVNWFVKQTYGEWTYALCRNTWFQSDLFIFTPDYLKVLTPEQRKECFVIYLDIPKTIRYRRMAKRFSSEEMTRREESDRNTFQNFTDFDLRITNPDN